MSLPSPGAVLGTLFKRDAKSGGGGDGWEQGGGDGLEQGGMVWSRGRGMAGSRGEWLGTGGGVWEWEESVKDYRCETTSTDYSLSP